MSTERTKQLPEYENSGGIETDLTLGLPGDLQVQKSGIKRGFSDVADLKMANNSKAESQPPSKTQVVGWPPVRSYRKNLMKNCKYVKVAVDGAPYLRKIDLEIYSSYQDLLSAMGDMFTCLTIRKHIKKTYLIDSNGEEYVPTYEDKDGDWMLVGDVPWKMFVESCKRVRLMRSSEAIGLGAEGPGTPSKGSSTSG